MDRKNSRKRSRFLHRMIRTALSMSLAAALVLGGIGTDASFLLPEAAAAVQKEEQAKSAAVYLDGAKGSKDGAGTSKSTAVSTFEKAKSLAGEKGTILVCGTVTIGSDTKLDMPLGITVKKADGFKGAVIKIKGSGKLTISYNWLSAADVDTKDADLGEKAFVVEKDNTDAADEKQKADGTKTENDDTQKTLEEKKDGEEDTEEEKKDTDDGKSIEQKQEEEIEERKTPPEVSIPETITMNHAEPLKSLSLDEGFSGDGKFRFAEPEKVPTEYETSCQIIFTPDDAETYDYSGVPGWSEEGKEVVRYITVYVEELKAPAQDKEEIKENEKEDLKGGSTEEKEDNEEKEDTVKEDTEKEPEVTDKKEEVTQSDTSNKKEDGVKQDTSDKQEDGVKEEKSNKEDLAENTEKADAEEKKEETSSEKKDDKNDEQKPAAEEEEKEEPEGTLKDEATGVSVYADFLPAYVELRVSVNGDINELPKADVQCILYAYHIELWNLITDEKYILPDNGKVTVRIPVPNEAKLYDSLVIAHYMEEKGEYEYFVPGQNLRLEEGYLVFETASFSPFNVGGNQLVGIGTQSQNHTPAVSTKPSGNTSTTQPSGSTSVGNGSNTSSGKKNPVVSVNTKTGNGFRIVNPRTGDESPVMTYIVIALAAIAVIVAVILAGKRKRK